MDAAASKQVAEGFLKGFSDVIGAMLSTAPVFLASEPEEGDAGVLRDLLAETPFLVESALSGGGAVLLLTALGDARRIVSAVKGEPAAAAPGLSDEERAAMTEVFDPCMGGGVGHFKERYGKTVALQPVKVRLATPDEAQTLSQTLGAAPALVRFSYTVPDAVDGGRGTLLFSQALADAVLAGARGERGMEQEVKDIVQDSFGAPAGERRASQALSRELPGNIDMILDIGLTVTARLGRIEMPLGQVLELGPGSIIDVGHSIDEPVELLVNNKLIARGDVVVVEEKFGLRITEIVSPSERIESLR